jgi:hypothetical protein
MSPHTEDPCFIKDVRLVFPLSGWWEGHGLITMLGSSLPPVVCVRAHVLLTMFGSSLPPVVCVRDHVLLTMLDSSLPPVVCVRAHVLLTMFGSSLPKDESNIVNKT